MGVPTFYRWLITRYPKIVKNVYENMDSDEYIRRKIIKEEENSYTVYDLLDYVNNTDKEHCSDNVNGYFDNLYLDMNGIIHCCSHPSGEKTPSSNDEIFVRIFHYIERLFDIIEPKKLLFMAIDGVAPKAKMNQQRSRRFKSILDSEIEKKMYYELREKFISDNRCVPEAPIYWDSNVITPGTEFMHELSVSLKYFIEYKITHDEKWKKIVVIFSDSNVCGEGEHKIYNFIKAQRFQKDYNPNIRHVIHGMDADLIMLSLASHEPYFYILREVIELDPKTHEEKKDKDFIGHLNNVENAQFCVKTKIKNKKYNKYRDRNYANIIRNEPMVNYSQLWNELQILDLTVLREYLSKDFEFKGQFNMERCIDDFVFICFLCGNDFLPHLPSISIVSGSIDQLILLYQNVLPVLGDYLTCEGVLNIKPVSKFLSFVAEVERETFISQRDFKKKREQKELQQKELQQQDAAKKVKYASEELNCENGTQDLKMDIKKDENVLLENTFKIKNLTIAQKERNIDEKEIGKMKQEKEESETQKNEEKISYIPKKKMYEEKILSMGPIRNLKYKEKAENHMINFLVRPKNNAQNESAENFAEKTIQSDNCVLFENENSEEESNADTQEKLSLSPKEVDILEFNEILKRAIKQAKENENPQDDVELGGDEDPKLIREKYYKSKFHLDESDDIELFVKQVVSKYLEGLAWVLLYYFQSCPMWHWYYPYYYSPLASDLVVDHITVNFEKDEPLLPFEQLLSVLPSSSCHCLPKPYRKLMLKNDSPIIDFYPTTFKEEENGKKFKYQWIVLLPFVDKERLLKHAAPIHELLTEEEKKRNRRGFNKIYVDKTHPFSKQMRKAMRNFLTEIKGNGIEKQVIEGQEEDEEEKKEEIEEQEKKKKRKIGKEETTKEEVEILERKKSQKKETGLCIEKIYKEVNTKVLIKNIKEVNIFGFFYFKHDDGDIEILKRVLKFSSNFSSTCNSAFYIQPEFEKHTSLLLSNHISPKPTLTIIDINNQDRKHRFNAAAARRMILNSLSNNHPHIYGSVRTSFYVKPDENNNNHYNNFNSNYNNNAYLKNQGNLYKFGTTYSNPFISDYKKSVNNNAPPNSQHNYLPTQRKQPDYYNWSGQNHNYKMNYGNSYMNQRTHASPHMSNHINSGNINRYDSENHHGHFLHYKHKDHSMPKTNIANHPYAAYGSLGGGESGGGFNQTGYYHQRKPYNYDMDRAIYSPNNQIGIRPNNTYKQFNKHGTYQHRPYEHKRHISNDRNDAYNKMNHYYKNKNDEK